MKTENISRRSFLKSSALVGAAGMVGTGSVLTSCANKGGESANSGTSIYKPIREEGSYYIPNLIDKANAGKELKAGLIGCGGRGSGAAFNFLAASDGVTITALGDTFQDKVDGFAEKLKQEKGIDIPADKRFVGFDAYKQVIDSGVDLVLVATPPYFRPFHFKYAVEKGVHCFLEKPIFVDAAGYRMVAAAAKQAQAKNVVVVTGTQRHHQRSYVESFKQIMNGMIGEITGGTVYWNGGHLWYKKRQPQWSDCEWMIRDWVNWKWLSGDHIVEQHVHNIDVFTWFSGLKPVSAVSFGSRQRRVTGDQFDNFSTDFTMENGIHLHSMCRQIDSCANSVSEFIQGTLGSWNSDGMVIKDLKGNVVWKFDYEAEKANFQQTDPYTLEHVDFINHIRSGEPLEQASDMLGSNLGAVMARESAYSGKMTTWDEMSAAPLDYTPKDMSLTGKMDMNVFTVAVPGTPAE